MIWQVLRKAYHRCSLILVVSAIIFLILTTVFLFQIYTEIKYSGDYIISRNIEETGHLNRIVQKWYAGRGYLYEAKSELVDYVDDQGTFLYVNLLNNTGDKLWKYNSDAQKAIMTKSFCFISDIISFYLHLKTSGKLYLENGFLTHNAKIYFNGTKEVAATITWKSTFESNIVEIIQKLSRLFFIYLVVTAAIVFGIYRFLKIIVHPWQTALNLLEERTPTNTSKPLYSNEFEYGYSCVQNFCRQFDSMKVALAETASLISHELKRIEYPILMTLKIARIPSITSSEKIKEFVICAKEVKLYTESLRKTTMRLNCPETDITLIQKQMTSISGILKTAIHSLNSEYSNLEAPNIQFKYIIDNDYNVSADEGRILTAIVNIIENAIQAISELEDKETCNYITIRLYSKKNQIILSIKNSGSYIAPENLQAVFLLGVSGKTNGVGAGLYLVNNIMSEHDWKIECRSSESPIFVEFLMYIPINKDVEKIPVNKHELPQKLFNENLKSETKVIKLYR